MLPQNLKKQSMIKNVTLLELKTNLLFSNENQPKLSLNPSANIEQLFKIPNFLSY